MMVMVMIDETYTAVSTAELKQVKAREARPEIVSQIREHFPLQLSDTFSKSLHSHFCIIRREKI